MTLSWLKSLQLTRFSRPRSDRMIYRAIARHRPQSIVEMGLGLAERSAAMIQLGQRYDRTGEFKYAGLDLFEGRNQQTPGITLKRAHRTLGKLHAAVQLFPGDPCQSLALRGNLLLKTDLIVVDLLESPGILERLWGPLLKLVHAGSHVYVKQRSRETQQRHFQLVGIDELNQRVEESGVPQRRAA